MKYGKSFIFAIAVATAAGASGAIPSGYYDKCENKGGKSLLSALHTTITNHHNVGYDGLWNVYKTSDVRADGTLWDIYSTKAWPTNYTKCGNYKKVGDCVNREHSFPKSWWGKGKSEQYSDAFHLYPTDGYVNNQRSNFPYGECANGKQVPSNGSVKPLGRLGSSTFPGYSGTVFEPDNEYKGDVARSYFYMAACYNDRISGWNQGNGAEMLAGNNFPVYKTWAINLLLKWHRQDPVSQKEKDRNEAIYKHQDNRNPFIDHPELVEYIWGDKSSQAWTSTGSVTPKLILPVDGSTVDLGATLVNVPRTAGVTVRGTNLASDISLSVSGQGFSVTPSTISKSSANSIDGATATVTLNPTKGGDFAGTLTIVSGNLRSTVNLQGSAVSTIPAGPVKAIGAESFTAIWSYVGDADATGNYTLDVRQGTSSIPGYPKSVKATDEYYTVNDLNPQTTYIYTVSSRSLVSEPVQVTTAEPTPRVDLLFDDDPMIYAIAGEPSKEAEILMEADYIDTDININVEAPFQLSSDKSNWGTSLKLSTDDDHFYLRVYSDKAGNYFTSLTVTAGSYYNDDSDFNAVVSAPGKAFYEDFEAISSEKQDAYDLHYYDGTMCRWKLSNAGIWDNEGRTGNGVRMSKNKDSQIEMQEDYTSGMGIVTIWTQLWTATEAPATYVLEYSCDGGQNWQQAGEGKVTSADWTKHTFTVNSAGPTRLRLRQTVGARFLVDDIEASSYSGITDAEVPDYHTWDAFCRNGKIVIETTRTDASARVYALDGTLLYSGRVAPGETVVDAPAGLYIVAIDDYARRVAVR